MYAAARVKQDMELAKGPTSDGRKLCSTIKIMDGCHLKENDATGIIRLSELRETQKDKLSLMWNQESRKEVDFVFV